MRKVILATGMAIGLLAWTPALSAELTAADRAFLEKKIIARWEFKDPGEIAIAYSRDIDILDHHPDPRAGVFRILVDAAQLASLRADGFDISVEIADWYDHYAKLYPQKTMGGFKTYAEAITVLDSVHAAFPSITTAKFSIGQSFEGREIWAIKVSDNPEVDEDEIEVLINGLHHAREPITVEVVLETLRRLTRDYGTDPLTTLLVDNREVFLIPVVNPDGYEYNRTIAPFGGGMWRKNRNNSNGSNIGVDLNRNYGHNWGYDNNGSSSNTGSEVYRGPSAFSEPETQAMRDFVNSRQFVFALNYHSYSDLYLWPWGYDFVYTPEHDFFQYIGDSLASFNGYTPQVGWELYRTNGDSDDWMYGDTDDHEKIYSFTPEVGGPSDNFWPSPVSIPGLINENQGPNFTIIGWEVADFDADTAFGDAPWTVNFTEDARNYPTGWHWDFGDGDTSDAPNPQHIYNAGQHTVTLTAASPTGGAMRTKTAFITALAESLVVNADSALPGAEVTWDININNHVPLSQITLPISISQIPAYATLDSITMAGTRTQLFLGSQTLFNNKLFGQMVIRLISSFDGSLPPLPPGSGPIARVHLTIKPGAVFGDSLVLSINTPLEGYAPSAKIDATDIGIFGDDGALTILTPPCECQCHTDPVCDGTTEVLDIVATVEIAFRNGAITPDPLLQCPWARSDVNCDGTVNVFDVVKLVDVAFRAADAGTTFCQSCGL
ncbi:MAG TPA: M14 family zinc carboxypeptidase [candidate division Zixibacteria bacterium]|jgi:PKD repeat protein